MSSFGLLQTSRTVSSSRGRQSRKVKDAYTVEAEELPENDSGVEEQEDSTVNLKKEVLEKSRRAREQQNNLRALLSGSAFMTTTQPSSSSHTPSSLPTPVPLPPSSPSVLPSSTVTTAKIENTLSTSSSPRVTTSTDLNSPPASNLLSQTPQSKKRRVIVMSDSEEDDNENEHENKNKRENISTRPSSDPSPSAIVLIDVDDEIKEIEPPNFTHPSLDSLSDGEDDSALFSAVNTQRKRKKAKKGETEKVWYEPASTVAAASSTSKLQPSAVKRNSKKSSHASPPSSQAALPSNQVNLISDLNDLLDESPGKGNSQTSQQSSSANQEFQHGDDDGFNNALTSPDVLLQTNPLLASQLSDTFNSLHQERIKSQLELQASRDKLLALSKSDSNVSIDFPSKPRAEDESQRAKQTTPTPASSEDNAKPDLNEGVVEDQHDFEDVHQCKKEDQSRYSPELQSIPKPVTLYQNKQDQHQSSRDKATKYSARQLQMHSPSSDSPSDAETMSYKTSISPESTKQGLKKVPAVVKSIASITSPSKVASTQAAASQGQSTSSAQVAGTSSTSAPDGSFRLLVVGPDYKKAFRVLPTTPLFRVIHSVRDEMKKTHIELSFNGHVINGSSTCRALKLKNMDQLEVSLK